MTPQEMSIAMVAHFNHKITDALSAGKTVWTRRPDGTKVKVGPYISRAWDEHYPLSSEEIGFYFQDLEKPTMRGGVRRGDIYPTRCDRKTVHILFTGYTFLRARKGKILIGD